MYTYLFRCIGKIEMCIYTNFDVDSFTEIIPSFLFLHTVLQKEVGNLAEISEFDGKNIACTQSHFRW